MSLKVIHATIEIKPALLQEVKEYLIDYAKQVRLEEGNIRFDVYLEKNTVHLDEAYKSEAAIEHHKNTSYFGQLMSFLGDKTVANGVKISVLDPVYTALLD